MAYDSLKALIRQYIKTNGEQEITGQILQNVLVEMVNQYPSTDGYATQSWVTTQLGDYLPLTGGTLSGNLTVLNSSLSVVTAGSSTTSYTTAITGSGIEVRMRMTGTPIDYRAVLNENGLTLYDQNGAGTTITRSSITSGSFIKEGGTSSQFLKADGSVDSSSYVTSDALDGYIRPTITNLANGDILIYDSVGTWVNVPYTNLLAGYATQSWVTSQLGGYLPLTGGTLTGWLYFNSSDYKIGYYTEPGEPSLLINSENHIELAAGGNIDLETDNVYCRGNVHATAFINTSDLRKKTITGDVPMNLYNVANAPLFKFTWNDEKKYSGQHIGSAAQYWQTVLPELVSIGRDADMTLAMQYDVIALASAITVAKTVVNHEERIILLERENEALKKEIADLKSA